MPYTRINIPLWARAVVGGAASFAAAIAVVAAAAWNPKAGWMQGLPEAVIVVFFAVLGALLLRYGLRWRKSGVDDAAMGEAGRDLAAKLAGIARKDDAPLPPRTKNR